MFRDAAAIDRQATDRRIAQFTERYAANAETWFDGSPDSVDRRIAACDQILSRAKAAAVRLGYQEGYTEIVADLEADRRSLAELREALLNGASDREVPAPLPGQRTASRTASGLGTQGHYLDFARAQGKDPHDATTAGWYSMVTGVPLEAIAPFLTVARRTAAGGWGDVDVDGGFDAGITDPVTPGSYDHYLDYAGRNGLDPGDSLTADRYSREHGVPTTQSSDFVMQFGNGGRHAAMKRALTLEPGRFVSDNADCLHYAPELIYRARRHAEDQSAGMSPEESRAYVAAFVARVQDISARAPRPRVASRPPTTVPDFPAELLYDE